jgi:hypothetical protein
MKANWKSIGIITASAAALVYPALRLYQFLMKAGKKPGNEEGKHVVKNLKFRGRQRKADQRHLHNGHAGLGHA